MNREELDSDNTPLHKLNGMSALQLGIITASEYKEYIAEREREDSNEEIVED